MATAPITVPIQHRAGTAAQWAAANTVLLLAEPGYETDTRKEKRGDGVTAWNSLPYLSSGSGATDTDGGTPTSTGSSGTTIDGGSP